MRRQGGNMGVGCIMSIVGGVLSLCIVGGVMVYMFYMSNRISEEATAAAYAYQPPAAVPAAFPTPGMPGVPAMPGPQWTGTQTFECGGVDNVTLTGINGNVTFSPAIRAMGSCNLSLVGVNLTAPVVIEASGNARVTVTGGTLTGTRRSVEASGNSAVTVLGATVTGSAERSGLATVIGVP